MITVKRKIHGEVASNGKVIHVLAALVLTLLLMAIQIVTLDMAHVHIQTRTLNQRQSHGA